MEEKLIKKFMTSIKCTACGQHYEIEDVRVLGHQEDLWFLSVSCSSCHTQGLVAAVIKEQNKKPELITDLTTAEIVKFREMSRITGNDLLDMHSFLKDFNGNFSGLFNPE